MGSARNGLTNHDDWGFFGPSSADLTGASVSFGFVYDTTLGTLYTSSTEETLYSTGSGAMTTYVKINGITVTSTTDGANSQYADSQPYVLGTSVVLYLAQGASGTTRFDLNGATFALGLIENGPLASFSTPSYMTQAIYLSPNNNLGVAEGLVLANINEVATSTPEPGSPMLLLTGLLAIVGQVVAVRRLSGGAGLQPARRKAPFSF